MCAYVAQVLNSFSAAFGLIDDADDGEEVDIKIESHLFLNRDNWQEGTYYFFFLRLFLYIEVCLQFVEMPSLVNPSEIPSKQFLVRFCLSFLNICD